MSAKIFLSFAVLCTILGSLQAFNDPECPRICPDNYDPTCGTDGQTFMEFDNECEMKAYSCRMQRMMKKTLTKTTLNWCHTEEVSDLHTLLVKLGNLQLNKVKCFQPCAAVYDPVCISNGKYRMMADECVRIAVNCALDGKSEAFINLGVDHC